MFLRRILFFICFFLAPSLYTQAVKTIYFNTIDEKTTLQQEPAFSEITDNLYVFSLCDGIISNIKEMPPGFYIIEITENSGKIIQYFDISAPLVTIGQKISKGEKIARIPAEKYGDILIFYSRKLYYEYDFNWPKIQFRFEIKPGMAIFSCGDGLVTINGYSPEKGRYVRIKNDTFIIEYFNLNTTKVLKGTQVTQGQIIGTSGLTGRTTVPSLSYAIFSTSGEEFLPVFILE